MARTIVGWLLLAWPATAALQVGGGVATPTGQQPKAAPAQQPSNPLVALSDGYSSLVKEHYLPMAFIQAGVLASSADIATQMMESSMRTPTPYTMLMTILHNNPMLSELVSPPADPVVSVPHVLAMALVASSFSGGANAVWLRQLEDAFPGKGARAVAAKTLIHAVILASIINSAYLIGVPLFTAFFASGHLPPLSNPSAYFAGWTLDEFITLTKLEVAMFIPYNTIAFKFVPPRVRPLTHAMVSATFNVAVSGVTLGYFDAWVERAMSIVG